MKKSSSPSIGASSDKQSLSTNTDSPAVKIYTTQHETCMGILASGAPLNVKKYTRPAMFNNILEEFSWHVSGFSEKSSNFTKAVINIGQF